MKKLLAPAFLAAAACISVAASAADAPKADLVNRKELRVCADPADLPSSNQKEEGYENKIAHIIADELKVPVTYTWFPRSMGFVKMTLAAKKCDIVMSAAQGEDLMLNTNAYMRSTTVLVYKAGGPLEGVETLADPKLQNMRIGVVQASIGGTLAAKYGLMSNVHGFKLNVDRRFENPTDEMMTAIRNGDIDAGIQWGPLGAYWASRGGEKLKVVPLLKDADSRRLAVRLTMGVRKGDDAWKRQLNDILRKHQGDIDKVLLDYGVPLLVDDDSSTEVVTAPRVASEQVASPAPAGAPATAAAEKPATAAAP